MAKHTGNYTIEAAKVLKNSERICCRVCDDGSIIVTNGHVLYRMDTTEYAAIVQPVTHCDAGNWVHDSTGRRDCDQDIRKIWEKTVCDLAALKPLEFCPLVQEIGKAETVGAYDASGDAVHVFNRSFIKSVSPSAVIRAKAALSPAVAFCDDIPFAVILPINPCGEDGKRFCRAVKSWFVETSAVPSDTRQKAEWMDLAGKLEAERNDAERDRDEFRKLAEQLVDELDEAKAERNVFWKLAGQQSNKLGELERERDELRGRLEALTASQQPIVTPQAPSSSDKGGALETIVARFTALPGIVATVNGARSATPVVWLSGNVDDQADAIKRLGGRWSAKRSAFYFRAA